MEAGGECLELAVEESRLESHREPMGTGCSRRLFKIFRHFDCEDDLCEAIAAAWDRTELKKASQPDFLYAKPLSESYREARRAYRLLSCSTLQS